MGKKQIVTVTMNPCIDKTIVVDELREGYTSQVIRATKQMAGKGINVAIGLKHLDVSTKCLVLGFEEESRRMEELFWREKIPCRIVQAKGGYRENIKIFNENTKQMTECNERGYIEDLSAMDRIFEVLSHGLNYAELLVISGSVPIPVSPNCYAEMIQKATIKEVPCILDASGELLLKGVAEKPFLIKPNLEEFMSTFGCKKNEVERKASRLVASGVKNVCISMGAEGAMLVNQSGIKRIPALNVDVCSLQGAGDAMVAGICKALYEDREDLMLEYGMAMAAATVVLEGTDMGTGDTFQKFLDQIINA